MKRLRQIAAWAAVCAVMALAARTPEGDAARRHEQALRGRWEGWAGVLRLWAFDGAFPDSLSASKTGRKSGKKAKKMVRPRGFEPRTQ